MQGALEEVAQEVFDSQTARKFTRSGNNLCSGVNGVINCLRCCSCCCFFLYFLGGVFVFFIAGISK